MSTRKYIAVVVGLAVAVAVILVPPLMRSGRRVPAPAPALAPPPAVPVPAEFAIPAAAFAAAALSAEPAGSAGEQVGSWLRAGQPERTRALIDTLVAGDVADRIVAARALTALHDYERLAVVANALASSDPDNVAARDEAYRWWLLSDDLAAVDRVVGERRAAGTVSAVDELAAAELALRLRDYALAHSTFTRALSLEPGAEVRARIHRGLGVIARQRGDVDASLIELERALGLDPLAVDIVVDLAESLIRAGKTAVAISGLELATRMAPLHNRAHYLLGSGYARNSYTELYTVYPERFSDAAGKVELARARALFAARDIAGARALLTEMSTANPGWADPEVWLGALEYSEGNHAAARSHYLRALTICSDYGRAHIGLARSQELALHRFAPHREADEMALATAAMPSIPELDRLVVNWASLSPRHQKRVALSILPWQRYVPVLVASGATVYIKPLAQVLSAVPGQEKLRDQRINYDSRLWDDVRGSGGYHMVAGIEDIESRIAGGYDTLLHELSHQVQMVLAPEWQRKIDALYSAAKQRRKNSDKVFLSQYAAGSVWEYFAEGANSLATPRRDRYDTGEMVRERLLERDPDLAALVDELMKRADVAPSYIIGLATKANYHLELGEAEVAISLLRDVLVRAPGDEAATSTLIYALTVSGRAAEARELAETAAAAHPRSAIMAIRLAHARWLAGPGVAAAAATLIKARNRIAPSERYQSDLALGSLLLVLGDPVQSERVYQTVLDYRADSPEGLWGRAQARALAQRWELAWVDYDAAVRRRTGVVELRVDYARDLLRAGELDRAGEQIEAALLLDGDDARAISLAAWLEVERGRIAAAHQLLDRALEIAPWCDLATIVRARAQRAAGEPELVEATLAVLAARIRDRAPPEFIYRKKSGRYDLVHTLPGVQQIMTRELLIGE